MSEKVIVGMSGGVDSSVSALLLKQQGYDVQGLFMKNWDEDDGTEFCTAIEDHKDAQRVCEMLDIPLHSVNFAAEYWDDVFENFLSEYKTGRTPNPDILCNREIKFKMFPEHAQRLGVESIATGHYSRIDQRDGVYRLLKGLDPGKDQTYFLYTLGQPQLKHSLFPIGEIHKKEVRELAHDAGFLNHAKKDSTGICFIGERRFKEFLSRYLPAQKGKMETPDGEEVGHHDGVMYYTLGQRQGLGIGGRKKSTGEPWYVVDKDVEHNRLIVAQGHNHRLLLTPSLSAASLTWTAGEAPELPYTCAAKTRYRQQEQPCTITAIDNGVCTVEFDEPQWAVTPGQSIVFYQADECLGGGIIQARW
ncbi:MAG: tRNA 2-thiouridine(34) synthase MnmA [Pseudomonadota bacterium]